MDRRQTSLDVERGQVETRELFAPLFEQVVGDFVCDELVERLHRGSQQTAQQLVDHADLVDDVRVHENVAQLDGQLAVFVVGTHALELVLQQRVAEAEGGAGELVKDGRVARRIVTYSYRQRSSTIR